MKALNADEQKHFGIENKKKNKYFLLPTHIFDWFLNVPSTDQFTSGSFRKYTLLPQM